jgi:hypothetical protein
MQTLDKEILQNVTALLPRLGEHLKFDTDQDTQHSLSAVQKGSKTLLVALASVPCRVGLQSHTIPSLNKLASSACIDKKQHTQEPPQGVHWFHFKCGSTARLVAVGRDGDALRAEPGRLC